MIELKDLSQARVVVTGASGFIGEHVCNHLIELGAEVYGVSRHHQVDQAGMHWLQLDLKDTDAVREAMHEIQPEYIFHLASFVKGARNFEYVIPTYESNVTSTINLLIAATELKVKRIVLAGTLEEHASTSHEPVPNSPYTASKLAASAYGRMFHALYETPAVIARIFMVYGPSTKDLTKIIPYTALSILKGESPKFSSGKRRIDWIYVEDVVKGLLAMAVRPGIEGKSFDLGTGELYSIREMIELLFEAMDTEVRPQFGALQDRPLESEITAQVDKVENELGWRAEVYLPEGLQRTTAWYKEHFKNYEKEVLTVS